MRNDVTIYVGIDFSKEKFNACLLMEQGVMGESEFPNSKMGTLSYNNIVNYLEELSKTTNISIHFPQREQKKPSMDSKDKLKKAEKKFFNRAFCSGLFSSLYILPDGQVTMCEQLYWNK